MLAIGWGPLIQLVVLIDHEDRENPFVIDGYYILRSFDQLIARLSMNVPS